MQLTKPILYVFLFLFSVTAIGPTPERSFIVNDAMIIKLGSVQLYEFTVGREGAVVRGRFRSADNIEVYIMDDDSYENWINGASVKTYYNSGRITVSNVEVKL